MLLARTALRRSFCTCLGALALSTLGPACATVVSGTDAVALGYGSPAETSAGYDEDPVPRPRVTGWAPPARSQQDNALSGPEPEGSEGSEGPVPHVQEVRDICAKRAELEDETPTQQCLRDYRIARLFRGLDKWKALVVCAAAAEDLARIDACALANPPAFVIAGEHEREIASCLHVFALSMVEALGPQTMFSDADLVGFEPLVRECVDTLIAEDRDDLGPKRYFEMLDCIDTAESTVEAERCESAQ